MADSPTTNFDLIEGHKENIQPVRSGRSARALVASLSPLSANPSAGRSEHYVRQSEFEQELKTASELDDPLEVWLQYINWTIETFPSGHSAEAGLLQLLERATREFAHDNQYKNDPRYLKLWIQYAQDFSDSPGEVFAYLARNDIGQRLALFYEEYAALLESHGRRTQAGKIYQSGLENNANPLKRLQRKYDEYLQRMEANPSGLDEPSSPALPAVRPALAAKSFGGAAASGGLGGEPNPQRQPQPAAAKPAKQKMAIFSDVDLPSGERVAPAKVTGGWDNIGSLEHRKRENAQEARPWAGEVMKQKSQAPQTEKLMIFRDNSKIHDTSSSLSISALGKRPERISVDLELVYPQEADGNNELCFEELRAKSRGLYDLDWNAQRDAHRGRHTQLRQPLEGSRTPIKVKTILSPSPKKGKIRRKGQGRAASPTMTFHTKAATDEIYGIFNQPLKTPAKTRHGGDSEESDFGDDSEGDYATASMVDNSGRPENPAEDDGDVESVHSDWSDFNLAKSMREPDGEPQDYQDDNDTFAGSHLAIATKMEKLSVFTDGQVPPKVKATARKLQIPSPPEDFNPPTLPYYQAKDQSHMQSRLPYMTPIVERTECLPATIARKALQAAKTPSRGAMPVIDDDDDFMEGSPFNDDVNKAPLPLDLLRKKPAAAAGKESSIKRNPIIDDTVCNPVDESMRAMIYNKLHPPLKSYEGYYEYSSIVSGKASEIKKFTKAMAKRDGGLIGTIPDTPLLEFVTGQGGSSYTVRRELGKGAYAPVYLVENNTVGDAEDELEEGALDTSEFNQIVCGRKRLEALKMEHPPSAWEFYMLKQAHIRLRDHRAAESIVRAYEMHQFKDEGFLLIEYRDQGTILDLVNIAKTESEPGVMDEILVMFFSIELLRTLEGLHAQGLIHGDIKPDNCLVRFDSIPDNEWSSKYQTDGSGGWSKKGVTFIDFGRGIDMTLFRPDVQFIADWKTDQQDCAEMREMRPWTYQVDYHGVAAIIHSMLYGKYIQTVAERSGLPGGGQKNYRLMAPFRRYWQKDIWSTLFDVLLNPLQHIAPEDGGALPITTAVRKCRQRMEGHVLANCDKGVGLKSMIRKLEVTVNKRK